MVGKEEIKTAAFALFNQDTPLKVSIKFKILFKKFEAIS